jgi:ABC-2 type transport system ATP-binding protein
MTASILGRESDTARNSAARQVPQQAPSSRGAEGTAIPPNRKRGRTVVIADQAPQAQSQAGEADPPAPVVATTALTKSYPGPVMALDQLTVRVAPGITALVGSNGAGKSTLVKVLLGLLPATSGSASVLGFDCGADGHKIRMHTGYMPEHDCLPPDVSGTEFVTHMGRMSGLPATAAKERAADSLRHVGLYEERYRQIATYSTGMKQRVKLAQALVGDPKLLLLDEPTNGLDPAGRGSMLDLISRIGTEFGISILVASHLLGEIEQICDQLVAIDGGRLLRADTISSFTRSSQVLLIEVEEGTAELAAELSSRGLAPAGYQRALLVQLDGDGTFDTVRDAIADLGLPLNRLEQRRHRLEELFSEDTAPAFHPTGAGDVR